MQTKCWVMRIVAARFQRAERRARWKRAATIGVALFFVVAPGCANKVPKPGVTYVVSVITKGNDGKGVPQEAVMRVESALVQDQRELTHEGQSLHCWSARRSMKRLRSTLPSRTKLFRWSG
jgi:hypothetical protein